MIVLPFPNNWALLLVCFSTCFVAFSDQTVYQTVCLHAWRLADATASTRSGALQDGENILRKMSRYLKTATLEAEDLYVSPGKIVHVVVKISERSSYK